LAEKQKRERLNQSEPQKRDRPPGKALVTHEDLLWQVCLAPALEIERRDYLSGQVTSENSKSQAGSFV